jgi:uncharacterized protein (DUF433 family)
MSVDHRDIITIEHALLAGRQALGSMSVDHRDIITIEPGKGGGKPCIRGRRIAAHDALSYLAAGMGHRGALGDFTCRPEEDILACLAYAAERERRTPVARKS